MDGAFRGCPMTARAPHRHLLPPSTQGKPPAPPEAPAAQIRGWETHTDPADHPEPAQLLPQSSDRPLPQSRSSRQRLASIKQHRGLSLGSARVCLFVQLPPAKVRARRRIRLPHFVRAELWLPPLGAARSDAGNAPAGAVGDAGSQNRENISIRWVCRDRRRKWIFFCFTLEVGGDVLGGPKAPLHPHNKGSGVPRACPWEKWGQRGMKKEILGTASPK